MAKKRKISKNYMDTVLIPNPSRTWSVREDGIVVVDVEHKGPFNRFAQKFCKKPRFSHIALDNYGTTLWNALDGKRTVFDVVSHMKEQFPDEEERMLDRVITFLHTLQTNRFIVIKE